MNLRPVEAERDALRAEAAEAEGWEMVPTIACSASPSAHVTEDAFERIVKVMVDGLAAGAAGGHLGEGR